MATYGELRRQVEDALEKEPDFDPLGPWNRCRDFDEDCADVPCKTACWLYDPEQGWCPYLEGDDR